MTEEIIANPGENELAVVPVGRKLSKLTEEEQRLASFLIDRGKDERIAINIPDDISDQELIRYTTSCLKVLGGLESAQKYLYPVVGRLVNIAAERPDFLKSFNCRDITEFIAGLQEKFGVNRSEVMYARKIVRLFPDITPTEYVSAGASKLKAIGKAADWEENDKIHEYKKFAEGHTRDELLEHMHQDGVDVSELNLTFFKVVCSQSTYRKIRGFFDDPRIQAYCETKSQEQIFLRMLEECESQWMAAEYYRAKIENPDFDMRPEEFMEK